MAARLNYCAVRVTGQSDHAEYIGPPVIGPYAPVIRPRGALWSTDSTRWRTPYAEKFKKSFKCKQSDIYRATGDISWSLNFELWH